MTWFLYALSLPQARHLEITAYKRGLFKTCGAVSALALPPLIPLGWKGQKALFDQLPRTPRPDHPWSAAGEQPQLRQGAWYLPLQESGSWDQLRGALLPDQGLEGLFPPFPGIYLAADDLQSPPACRIGGDIDDFKLVLLEITCPHQSGWWNDLFFRLIDRRHLR